MIAADEPPPFRVENEGAAGRFFIVCDHAGQAIPRALGDLGLAAGEIDRHIGWDIGAASLTRCVAERLGACAVLQPYSRLVIDCNRAPERPDAMPAVSDGAPVPANAALDAAGRAKRINAIHAPYHERIAELMDARARAGRETTLVLLHSFTPVMGGIARPWRLGVLHRGEAFPRAVLDILRRGPEGPIGDNEPYTMDEVDYTAARHGVGRGLPYVEIEVRQDLLGAPADQARMADVLASALIGASSAAG